MKVDDIPAGEKLNTLMAEEVMRWHKVEQDGTWRWHDGSDDCLPNYLASEISTAGYKIEDVKPWSPSSDFIAAWEVIKRMMEASGDIPLKFADEIEFECEVRNYWDDEIASYLVLKNLTPEIVCRAALRAAGVTEVPD
jgi:hypothetical protein